MRSANILLTLWPWAFPGIGAYPTQPAKPPGPACFRDYFYVGGEYAETGSGSGAGHIFQNQMYVEHLVPLYGVLKPFPLVFIHGQAQTGTNWLNTPDGRKGWASWFIENGYEVYIIDQTARARSPYTQGNGTWRTYTAETIQERFTATRYSKLWPQGSLHTQWPGTGMMGDPTFDAYYASNVQFSANTSAQQTAMQAAGAALLDRIGPAVLIAHSQGGLFPWLIADVRPNLVKLIVALEPTGPPFRDVLPSKAAARKFGLTDVPVAYDPPVGDPSVDLKLVETGVSTLARSACLLQAQPVRRLVNLVPIPVLLVTAEASFHAVYDSCTVEYLRQAGVSVEHVRLEEVGICGNGHLSFMEMNNLEIAAVVEWWIQQH